MYGVPDDLIIVNLESIYPELKGKRLRGRLEGRVLKPYDDASAINGQGSSAKPTGLAMGEPSGLVVDSHNRLPSGITLRSTATL